jgi:hypothetical protein
LTLLEVFNSLACRKERPIAMLMNINELHGVPSTVNSLAILCNWDWNGLPGSLWGEGGKERAWYIPCIFSSPGPGFGNGRGAIIVPQISCLWAPSIATMHKRQSLIRGGGVLPGILDKFHGRRKGMGQGAMAPPLFCVTIGTPWT